MKSYTKKQNIIDMFNSIDWFFSSSMDCDVKTITHEHFEKRGLNGKDYCDVFYARKIIQEMGHRVLIGAAFYVYKNR